MLLKASEKNTKSDFHCAKDNYRNIADCWGLVNMSGLGLPEQNTKAKVGLELACPEAASIHCKNKVECKKPSCFELKKLCCLKGPARFGKFLRILYNTYSKWKDHLCSGQENMVLCKALCWLLRAEQDRDVSKDAADLWRSVFYFVLFSTLSCFLFCLVFCSVLISTLSCFLLLTKSHMKTKKQTKSHRNVPCCTGEVEKFAWKNQIKPKGKKSLGGRKPCNT